MCLRIGPRHTVINALGVLTFTCVEDKIMNIIYFDVYKVDQRMQIGLPDERLIYFAMKWLLLVKVVMEFQHHLS
jgi:hypothetical protein